MLIDAIASIGTPGFDHYAAAASSAVDLMLLVWFIRIDEDE